jgi:hypothetical protein
MTDNTCVCCGRIIPDGRQVCLACGDYDDMQIFTKGDSHNEVLHQVVFRDATAKRNRQSVDENTQGV